MIGRIVHVFLAAEAVLYAAFLILDIRGITGPDVWLKFIGILLCLLFSLWGGRLGGDVLVFPALVLTVLADSLLLVLKNQYALGVLLFLGVQSLYLIRLRLACRKSWWFVRGSVPLLFGVLLTLLGAANPLTLLAGLYFAQLVVNTILAWTVPGPRWRIFAVGLTLFIFCDLCVAVCNFPGLVSDGLLRFAQVGMWLFYLPSQVLIALSALPEKGTHHEIL